MQSNFVEIIHLSLLVIMLQVNHVLPTSGNVRFESGLSVLDFQRSSYIEASKSLSSVVSVINNLAEIEGLTAHALSANIRFQRENNCP